MPHRRITRAAMPPPPIRPPEAPASGEGAWFARPLDVAAPEAPTAGEPALAFGEVGLFKQASAHRGDAVRRRKRA